MLKKIILLSAVTILPASAFAGDFRTLSHASTPAQSMHANGNAIERRTEAPYALTGERRSERRSERRVERQQDASRRFNWQAGSANFRPGK